MKSQITSIEIGKTKKIKQNSKNLILYKTLKPTCDEIAKAGNLKARAACEWSEGGGCISPKYEGGRRQRFTAGLARFFCFRGGQGKGSDCTLLGIRTSSTER